MFMLSDCLAQHVDYSVHERLKVLETLEDVRKLKNILCEVCKLQSGSAQSAKWSINKFDSVQIARCISSITSESNWGGMTFKTVCTQTRQINNFHRPKTWN